MGNGDGNQNGKPTYKPDTLATALKSVDRTFDGEEVDSNKGAGTEEDEGREGLHPAERAAMEREAESEEREAESEERKAPAPSEPKFASQQEAEKAYEEAQRALTAANMKLSDTTDRLLSLVGRGGSEQSPEQEEAEKEAGEAEYIRDRRLQAIKEIEELDPDDDGHRERVAEIQARADADILSFGREQERKSREREQEQRASVLEVERKIDAAMEEKGLDPKKGSPDRVLFGHFANEIEVDPVTGALTHNGRSISEEDAVKMTVDAVINYNNKTLERFKAEEAQRRASRAQDEDAPLPPGAEGPPRKPRQAPANKPATLGDTLAKIKEARVV